MIEVKIPKSAPQGGDLRVNIKIGRQGFSRSEIYKANKWAPEQMIWVDFDTISVEFTRMGKENYKETVYLVPF
jgi:hypothetical protein